MSQYARAAVAPAAGSVFVLGIVAVVGAFLVAQGLTNVSFNYMMGTIGSWSGYFYVLKYVEYFVIYYMAVNNLRDREHAWRLVGAAFITAAIVSVIGLAQVPSGERVSAPFEGEVGEPNTFGGYLLFMMAIAAAIALETQSLRRRAQCLGLLALMAVPFFFTLSRASYLGIIPAFLVIARFTTRRRFVVGLILFAIVTSPALLFVAPKAVKERVAYTFIIVRILEPVWLITGLVMMVPVLEAKERIAAAAAARATPPTRARLGVRP